MAGEYGPWFMGFNPMGRAVYELPAETAAAIRRRLATGDLAGRAAVTHVAFPGDSYVTASLLDTRHEDAVWINTDHEVAPGWEAIALNPTAEIISALRFDELAEQ